MLCRSAVVGLWARRSLALSRLPPTKEAGSSPAASAKASLFLMTFRRSSVAAETAAVATSDTAGGLHRSCVRLQPGQLLDGSDRRML